MENEAETTQKRDGAPKHHISQFARDCATAARAIRMVWPRMSSEQIAADLGNGAKASSVRCWRTGRRPIPEWVHEHMRARTLATLAAIERVTPGKGKDAGARALAAWRAARNLQR